MSRQEAYTQYTTALKAGQKYYRDAVTHGRYPYPQVLDETLVDDAMVVGRVDLGVVEIPTEQIVGTKTAGRRTAFAGNFMPLLGVDTEFAAKWMTLCEAHLGDEGIREPIRCFEYLGRFYVQEGNKRVSVLRSYDAPTIPGRVTRVVPVWSEDPVIRMYYEFMESYRLTRLYRVSFTRPGSFLKLQATLGFEPDHPWTEEEQQRFESRFTYFRKAFDKLGGGQLPITACDALLVWLKVYSFDDLRDLPAQQVQKNLAALWPDVKALTKPDLIAVATDPEPAALEAGAEKGKKLFGRLIKTMFPKLLTAAFVSEYAPEESDWARAHYLGRQYLEAVLGDRVSVMAFDAVKAAEAADVMETAVDAGAQVIFATTPPLIAACRKIAAKHPDVRVLNCAASMPYTGVRTYYSKIYEAKFVTGVLAGALSRTGRIGYVGSTPIFGVPAAINAFCLGARMTNPEARILLRWSCAEEDPMAALMADGADLICNRDLPTPDRVREPWGLCRVNGDGTLTPLASPYWHWGHFYEKLARIILSGGWDTMVSREGDKAVNYWWGMKSQVVDVLLSAGLPAGPVQLVDILRRGIVDGSVDPFRRPLRDRDGTVRSDGEHWFSPAEILHMDWLCEGVEGRIPAFDELLPMSRGIVRLQGVYRDDIPPEKEGTLL